LGFYRSKSGGKYNIGNGIMASVRGKKYNENGIMENLGLKNLKYVNPY
jgi:hypothetical protein